MFSSSLRATPRLAFRTASRLTALRSHISSRTMTSLPSTMKGVIIEKTGGTEVLQYKTDLPIPTPKEGQILVKNDFIGVNYIDTYFRTGLYKAPSFPYMLGREASGTIISTGPGETYALAAGDKVIWMGTEAYAEYSAVPAIHASKIPNGIPQDVAAASMLQGLTALTLIREAHAVKKGDWVLVHAAAGGVGLWLCQLLKAVGAHTIATASTPEKRDLARKAGAEVLIDYTSEDVPAKVKEATNGQGVIAVFDSVGKSTFDISMESLARRGSMISFGNASGTPDPVVLARLSPKNARLLRPTLFSYIVTREEYDGYAQELFKIILNDKLDVKIHEFYPLSDIARAHQDIEGRKTTGKLLLKP